MFPSLLLKPEEGRKERGEGMKKGIENKNS